MLFIRDALQRLQRVIVTLSAQCVLRKSCGIALLSCLLFGISLAQAEESGSLVFNVFTGEKAETPIWKDSSIRISTNHFSGWEDKATITFGKKDEFLFLVTLYHHDDDYRRAVEMGIKRKDLNDRLIQMSKDYVSRGHSKIVTCDDFDKDGWKGFSAKINDPGITVMGTNQCWVFYRVSDRHKITATLRSGKNDVINVAKANEIFMKLTIEDER